MKVLRVFTLLAVMAGVVLVVAGPVEAAPRRSTVVTLRTNPVIEGVTFELGAQTFRTDRRGTATLVTSQPQRIVERIQVLPEVAGDPDQQVRFARWYTDELEPGRIRATVVLDVFVPTVFTFSSPQGPVENDSVTSMTLQSSVGERTTIEGAGLSETHWLFARRVVSRQGGLVVKPIQYSVLDVVVDGAEVVNRSELRFLPAEDQAIEVPLLFYPASVRVRDAVFGTPAGDSIELIHPDGEVVRYPLGEGGRVDIASLPRGRYDVSVQGQGLELIVPMEITRPQEIDIRFLSYFDIALAGAVLIAFVVGLPLLGRRRARRRAERTFQARRSGLTSVPSEKVMR